MPGSQVGLVEHREMTIPPGGTACPSERYAPLWAALEGDMTRDEVLALLAEFSIVDWTLDANGTRVPITRDATGSHFGLDKYINDRFAEAHAASRWAKAKEAFRP